MGLFRSVKRFFFGKKPRQQRVERFTEQQRNILNTLLSQGAQDVGSPALEDRYKKLFEEQLLPSIAQQFTTSGGQRSGAFASALGRAGTDLSSQLAAMRSGRGMQKLGMGLAPQFDVENIPGSPGAFQHIAGDLSKMLVQMAGGMGKGQGGQQQQFPGQDQGYMPGQPQGFDSSSVSPMMLKMLMGMLL